MIDSPHQPAAELLTLNQFNLLKDQEAVAAILEEIAHGEQWKALQLLDAHFDQPLLRTFCAFTAEAPGAIDSYRNQVKALEAIAQQVETLRTLALQMSTEA